MSRKIFDPGGTLSSGQGVLHHLPLSWDATRLIEDALNMQRRLIFSQERLVEVQLNELHPHATHVATGLERLLDHFGHP